MKLPSSCQITHKPRSKSISIECGSAADLKKVKSSLGIVPAKKSKSATKGKSPSKAKGAAKSKGRSAQEKEESGATPLLLASCVVKVVSKELSSTGRRKATSQDLGRAYAICTAALQKGGSLRKGTRQLTAKGQEKDADARERLGEDGVNEVFEKLDQYVEHSKR